ncbi:MAG: hypothetical protein RLP44_16385 [Aggregatilineales bacterium]
MGFYDPQHNFDPKKMKQNQERNYNYKGGFVPLADRQDFSQPAERGGCLSIFLVLIFGGTLFLMFAICSTYSEISSIRNNYYVDESALSQATGWLALGFALGCAQLACVVALWNYKSWGFYGLMISYGLGIVLNMCGGNIPTAIGSMVGMGILYALVNPILYSLE